MYVILTYDVAAKRAGKVARICKQYLRHVQRSVFEGGITRAKLESLKAELQQKTDRAYDSIRIYELNSPAYSRLEVLGQTVSVSDII